MTAKPGPGSLPALPFKQRICCGVASSFVGVVAKRLHIDQASSSKVKDGCVRKFTKGRYENCWSALRGRFSNFSIPPAYDVSTMDGFLRSISSIKRDVKKKTPP